MKAPVREHQIQPSTVPATWAEPDVVARPSCTVRTGPESQADKVMTAAEIKKHTA